MNYETLAYNEIRAILRNHRDNGLTAISLNETKVDLINELKRIDLELATLEQRVETVDVDADVDTSIYIPIISEIAWIFQGFAETIMLCIDLCLGLFELATMVFCIGKLLYPSVRYYVIRYALLVFYGYTDMLISSYKLGKNVGKTFYYYKRLMIIG